MKKTLSLILAIVMLLSLSLPGFSAPADEEFNGVITAVSELGQLESMGVMNDIGHGAAQNITRAEMAKIVTRLLAMPEPVYLSEYTDVSAHNPYSGSIRYVTNQEIMTSYNDELFLPDKDVSYYEVIKALITLLGYDQMALQKGGDPHGYMTIANSLGLVIFPSGTDRTLSKEEIAKIIIKAIDVPLMIKTSYDSQVVYQESEGTIKTEYLMPELSSKSSGEKTDKATTSAGELHENKINSVNTLIKLGVLRGDEDGSLRLADTITRAEATALLLRINANYSNVSELELSPADFDDIKNHWAVNEISFAYANGIVNGTGEKTFEPERNVSVQEFAKMLVTLLGYKYEAENEGEYPHGYMLTAHRIGIFKNLYLAGPDDATREQVAVMLANALDIPLMMQTGFGTEKDFTVMDGKNGVPLETLAQTFENR